MGDRDTRYARAPDGAYIAYQVVGDGPVDLAVAFDWVGNIDLLWGSPGVQPSFDALSSFTRLILYDRRGMGLSSRNVQVSNLETRVSDMVAVLDAVRTTRPALFGFRESGAPHAMLAASDPERVRSLVWITPSPRSEWAPDYPWGARPEYVEKDQATLELWGTREYARAFQETEATAGHHITPESAGFAAFLSRQIGTPDVAAQISQIWYQTDVRGLLPSVQCPTLLLADVDDAGEAEYTASLLPNASLVLRELPRDAEDYSKAILFVDEIRRFLGVEPPRPELDSVLTTVLFTDIVGSSNTQASLGDRGWKELLERHHGLVRSALERWRGVENDRAGDGFYATFDGPARAIRCALEIADRVGELGIEVRAGLHTGECQLVDGKAAGIVVAPRVREEDRHG